MAETSVSATVRSDGLRGGGGALQLKQEDAGAMRDALASQAFTEFRKVHTATSTAFAVCLAMGPAISPVLRPRRRGRASVHLGGRHSIDVPPLYAAKVHGSAAETEVEALALLYDRM
jgi:hypothetical protein